ncbi:uncharacterized protein LOC130722226 [Lotus japonicus]|uniref:uncharacterized protein LOC130722226 n=1 Tax=Lotus japonicus TaxID=34305 RepID=UPI002582E09E|nr:uncharacterized protein LOC130722226 [Lotus japonicus]
MERSDDESIRDEFKSRITPQVSPHQSRLLDDDTFSKASLAADQARTIKLLDQRVHTLKRELDAAITAAARARSEKRHAENAQRAAESRALEVTKELENTTSV